MKKTLPKLTLFIGAMTAIGASALWAAFWWRWVAREYKAAPAGSNNLEHAIFNEIAGTLFVGFTVFWLFRRIVCAWQKMQLPSVSPIDVMLYLTPSLPKVDPTSNQAIAYLWLRSAMSRTMTNAAYRLGRLVHRMWPH